MVEMHEQITSGSLKLFLAGDVMTGRGVDQILPHPSDPELYECHTASALDYLRLAERRHGSISRPVSFSYIWGDGLAELSRQNPDVRLVNLGTAITRSNTPVDKGINYRMSPENVDVLSVAWIQACVLANNHVLDWGVQGLIDTLDALQQKGIAAVGAGRNHSEATAPIAIDVAGKGRVIVIAFGCPTSGIPSSWQATADRPGVNVLSEPLARSVVQARTNIQVIKQPGDIVVASIHWGGNWGYDIPPKQRALAHELIDQADVDVIFGHSSHHPKAIELYRDKLVLYGCGDLINDYEGISDYEAYHGDLSLMYFPHVAAADGRLQSLEIVPLRIRSMRLERADQADAEWLCERLRQQSAEFETDVRFGLNGVAHLQLPT